jgi:hypothetical protein
VLTEGGSGTPAPDISIEVDNLDEVHWRASATGLAIDMVRRASHGVSDASTFGILLGACSTSSLTKPDRFANTAIGCRSRSMNRRRNTRKIALPQGVTANALSSFRAVPKLPS